MIKEAYCSIEVCKLLKEKGFDEPCNHFYKFGSNELYYGSTLCNSQLKGVEIYNSCTHQMAMAWLREKGLFIEICCDDLDYNWQVLDVLNRDENADPIAKSESYGGYKQYEEAVEAALKYSLENLI